MAHRIYPVTKTELSCDDYRVLVNGQEVALDAARVSAIPFNRRWPGYQRQIEQTEMINFLSFAMDEPVTLEIFPKKPANGVEIRPRSAGIKHELTDKGSILVHLEKPQYFTVEPYGRSHALHVFADDMPAYGIDFSDPNVIYYGAGEHDVGNIELESNQTLYLDEGAVVYACVHAADAQNIRILGRGILDNSKNKEKILFEAKLENNDAAVENAERIHTIQLEYCENVEIDGITMRDSLVYNVRPRACRNLTFKNIKIIGCWRYNSDGIDMHNCENVLIENCFIRTFDDCICVKGFDCFNGDDDPEQLYVTMNHNGVCYDTFRHVHVRNCVLWNDWGKCLEIGAETRAEEMCDILFEDCDVIHVNYAPLDVMNVDWADVHDVIYRNIRIELDDVIPQRLLQRSDDHVYEQTDPDYVPAIIYTRVVKHHEYSRGGTRRGRIRDILFENIDVYGRQNVILKFEGYDGTYTSERITVRNLRKNGKHLTAADVILQQNEFCRDIVIE